jgi:hypothetical protein
LQEPTDSPTPESAGCPGNPIISSSYNKYSAIGKNTQKGRISIGEKKFIQKTDKIK